jgi:hypothetical protein
MRDSDDAGALKSVAGNLTVAANEKSGTKAIQADAPDAGDPPSTGGSPASGDMPPQIVKQVQSFLATFESHARTSEHPLFAKFTAEHIDKYLDSIQRDDDHAHELRKSNRWFYLGYFVLILAAIALGIGYLLPRDKDLLLWLVQILVILIGGVGIGYGINKREKK